jgi:hypothetical protein
VAGVGILASAVVAWLVVVFNALWCLDDGCWRPLLLLVLIPWAMMLLIRWVWRGAPLRDVVLGIGIALGLVWALLAAWVALG